MAIFEKLTRRDILKVTGGFLALIGLLPQPRSDRPGQNKVVVILLIFEVTKVSQIVPKENLDAHMPILDNRLLLPVRHLHIP